MTAAASLRFSSIALLLAATLVLPACQTTPVVRQAEDLYQGLLVKTRSRGERQLSDATTVARELACSTPGAPVARFESSAVLPERPKPGREINHRLVVAACPQTTEVLAGTLTRRFSHLGRTLFEDSEPIALKPGRWAIDVFVGIPAQAPPGPYRLDVRFERKGSPLLAASEFTVIER